MKVGDISKVDKELFFTNKQEQAGAELCQAKPRLRLSIISNTLFLLLLLLPAEAGAEY